MQKKSQVVSFFLTLFFGALGLLYSNVIASMIMIVVSIFALASLATGSTAFLTLSWLATIVIGAFMVNNHNENVDSEEKKQKEMQEEMVKKAIEDSKMKDFTQEQMIRKIIQETK